VRALELVPRQHRHVRRRRERLHRGDGEQPDRPGTDDQQPLAGLRETPAHGMHRAGERLDQHPLLVAHRVRQAHQLRRVGHELLAPTAADVACRADEHARR
jgi:hypothetical protein